MPVMPERSWWLVGGFVLLCMACGPSGPPAPPPPPAIEPQPEVGDTLRTTVVPSVALDTSFAVDTLPLGKGALHLVPAHVQLANGKAFDLRIPAGYALIPSAEGLGRARFIAQAPDGRLFVTDMHDLTDNTKGRVLVLDGWDEEEGRFRSQHTYLKGLHNPNQCAFFTAGGHTWLYVATTDRLLRYPYVAGDTVPSGAAEVIATFPAYGLGYKYGGWHLTRSIAFHGGQLYVSVGSSCNACVEKEDVRATILSMDPDGHHMSIYASGLRNAVGLTWAGDELYATNMGSDQFGWEEPQDQLQRIVEGRHYGWPYYHQFKGHVVADTAFVHGDVPGIPPPPNAYASLGAHTAPLGVDLFRGFAEPVLDHRFLVALHGSSIVKMGKGYAIVAVRRGAPTIPVVDGFLQGKERYGRPCDVRMRDADSFWYTDDLNGVLYLVRKKR